MRFLKNTVFVAFLALTANFASAQDLSDKILGVWTPGHGKARVKIEKVNGKFIGTTVWLKEPNDPETGKPATDKNNPDPALQSRPRLGMVIMKDFEYKEGTWVNGTIYDPGKGKTYCGKIKMVDNDHIDMRGNICGFSLLGRTDTWTRYKGN